MAGLSDWTPIELQGNFDFSSFMKPVSISQPESQHRIWFRPKTLQNTSESISRGTLPLGRTNTQGQVQTPLESNSGASGFGSRGLAYVDAMLRSAQGAKYSQLYRNKDGYFDCSSFLQRNGKATGYNFREGMTTATMPKDMVDAGFVALPYDKNNLQYGDVLHRDGHTETYLGNGYVIGAHSAEGGVGIAPLSNFGDFTTIFRYNGRRL